MVIPNELILLFVGFVVGMLVRPKDPRQLLRGSRRVIGIAALVGLLVLSISLTFKYLHGAGGTFSLQQISQNNAGSGAGHGSSNLTYSGSFAAYPRDVYYVLFDPLPVTAHGTSQRIQSVENLIIIILIIKYRRSLRSSVRVALQRPYVMIAGVFSVAFCYTFAALGNLGLIPRERTLLFPLFLVLLSIPLSPKGAPPAFPWEQKRLKRRGRGRHKRYSGPGDSAASPGPG